MTLGLVLFCALPAQALELKDRLETELQMAETKVVTWEEAVDRQEMIVENDRQRFASDCNNDASLSLRCSDLSQTITNKERILDSYVSNLERYQDMVDDALYELHMLAVRIEKHQSTLESSIERFDQKSAVLRRKIVVWMNYVEANKHSQDQMVRSRVTKYKVASKRGVRVLHLIEQRRAKLIRSAQELGMEL